MSDARRFRKVEYRMSSSRLVRDDAIHTLPVNQVYAALSTRTLGLTSAEAAARLAQFGPNAIREIKGKPLSLKFLENFTHLMALLLWVGGLIAFIAQMPQLGIAIWFVNLINGVFSFWQEYRAEKATAALRRMLPQYVRVVRDETEQRILADELVPGEVMLLAEGDRISADARLVEEAELRVDQSTLTGEAHPVRKTRDAVLRTDLSRVELPNLVFAGTIVVAGSGKAVVIATGMNTEFGQIAHLTQVLGEELSPLQKELAYATKIVTAIAVGVGALFFTLAIALARVNLAESFIFALGMIVAFVPEGMLPTVTLALAMGTQRMAQRNALIKKLSAVETLGCTTIIGTDKTGTLTENEMTVRQVWVEGRRLSVSGAGYAPEGQIRDGTRALSSDGDAALRQLLTAAALCNNARLLPPNGESSRWAILGDPTEAALLVAARKGGLDLDDEAKWMPRVRELPFDSRRKRMSTIHQVTRTEERGPSSRFASLNPDASSHITRQVGIVCDDASPPSSSLGTRIAYVKGAPKEILALSNCIWLEGAERLLNETLCAQIMAANDDYARNGLRVLAVAMRNLGPQPTRPDSDASASDYKSEAVERDLTFLGLMAMMGPPRPEVAQAVEKCRRAGIRVIMITGDYGLTAESIARRIGILRGDRTRIIAGVELDTLDDATLQAALRDEVIFARVAPEHKLRVVSALQTMGHIVAVTGDGVNDAPALKKADIGVAMGIAGTDVAKEAADMILTDDNFASIVNAVEEGRAVYANIRKFATYVFNSNMAEAVPFMALLFSHGAIPLPLTVMQVLAIDLGTDMVPAIGLGAEPAEAGTMDYPPRSQQQRLLTAGLLARALLWYGMIESVAAMSAYFYLNWLHGWPGVPLAADGTFVYQMATTMTLAGIVATQIGAVFGCRSDRISIFRIGFLTNRLVLVGIAVELTLLALLVYAPFLHEVFNTAPIGLREWAFVFAWTPVIFFADELRKLLLRWIERRHPARISR